MDCIGTPDWVIEILFYKTTEKFELYQSNGGRKYWIGRPCK